MRYVSGITCDDGREIGSFTFTQDLFTEFDGREFKIKGRTYQLQISGDSGELLGVGYGAQELCAVVTHTHKTALLHNYIEVVDRMESSYVAGMLKALGECGSVAITYGYNKVGAVCTLYDYLCVMCRRTSTNLLQRETLQFGGHGLPWVVKLRLHHDKEADRYWTKMYMDAVGGYSGHLEKRTGVM